MIAAAARVYGQKDRGSGASARGATADAGRTPSCHHDVRHLQDRTLHENDKCSNGARRPRSTRSTSGDAEFGELGRHRSPVRRGAHLFVDIEDPTVDADVEGPARGERLIFINDAICLRDALVRIAEQRIVHTQGPREGLVGVQLVDAGGEIGHVERPKVVATLTE
jgi:hypothetical protein